MHLKSITKRQSIFLWSYPFIHCGLSAISLMMVINGGVIWDPGDPPLAGWQIVVSQAGKMMLGVFLAPIMISDHLGLRYFGPPAIQWFSIYMIGFFYGFAILYLYKLGRNR